MKIFRLFLCGVVSVLVFPRLAQSATELVTDENSSLSFTRSATPVSVPSSLEWIVDGRRILVYPSNPSVYINVFNHVHSAGHVEPNQLHAKGVLVLGAVDPDVTGGVVYTVDGGSAGSGVSRLYEKVDIFNGGNNIVSLTLSGLGGRPTDLNLEIPDFTGLDVSGTTIAFVQGNGYRDPQGTAHSGTIVGYPPFSSGYTSIPTGADPTFASVTVLPALSFSGFNTFSQPLSLPPGATLTMITELNVKKSTSPSTPGEPDVAFIEGESYTSSRGVAVENTHLARLDNGDWAGYSNVNFGSNATIFEALVAVDPAYANQKLEIRLGSPSGTKIGELTLLSTGGFGNFQMQSTPLTHSVSGTHDVYLVPVGTFGAGNIDKFRFISK